MNLRTKIVMGLALLSATVFVITYKVVMLHFMSEHSWLGVQLSGSFMLTCIFACLFVKWSGIFKS